MKALNETPKVSLEEKAKTLPAVDEEEDLLSWCQRVTKDYHSVKITDFTYELKLFLNESLFIWIYVLSIFPALKKKKISDNRYHCYTAHSAVSSVRQE